MKITKLTEGIVLFENFIQEDLKDKIIEESKIINAGRSGRKMVRMTDDKQPYMIGSKKYHRKDFSESVNLIRARFETLEGSNGIFSNRYFNTCILNYYPNARSGFRLHTDYMKNLEDPMIIATVSFGTTREMRLHFRPTKEEYKVPLTSGSMLLMGPHIQRKWLHGIDRNDGTSGDRLSLSFRRQIPITKSKPNTKPLI